MPNAEEWAGCQPVGCFRSVLHPHHLRRCCCRHCRFPHPPRFHYFLCHLCPWAPHLQPLLLLLHALRRCDCPWTLPKGLPLAHLQRQMRRSGGRRQMWHKRGARAGGQ